MLFTFSNVVLIFMFVNMRSGMKQFDKEYGYKQTNLLVFQYLGNIINAC